MRRWSRLSAVSLPLAIGLLSLAGAVSACSCSEPAPVAEAMRSASVVFSGRVQGLTLIPRLPEDPRDSYAVEDMVVTFAVSGVWKGPVLQEIDVVTAFTCCICGFPFELGDSYLVYATFEDDLYRVSLCSRTKRLDDAASECLELGSPIVPGAVPLS